GGWRALVSPGFGETGGAFVPDARNASSLDSASELSLAKTHGSAHDDKAFVKTASSRRQAGSMTRPPSSPRQRCAATAPSAFTRIGTTRASLCCAVHMVKR